MFRFYRAQGGHANDGDTLTLGLRYNGSEEDLLAMFAALGIAVQRYGPDTPQPVPGHAYTGEEFQRFPALVYGHPSIGQPSHVRLHGVACHVWAARDQVEITIQSELDVWEVDDAAVERARMLEAHLEPLAGRVIEPPVWSRNVVCPTFYPEIWQ